MRRKDRAMGEAFAYRVIDQADYGVLSIVNDEGMPYGVPLSIVRDNQHLYFHSAKAGTKVDLFQNSPKVSITFVSDTNIPELFTEEELQSFLTDEKKTASLTSKVFTTEYASAIVSGTIHLVENSEEAIHALRLICLKYTPSKMAYFDLAIQSGLSRTNIYRIAIEKIDAKRKKFDSSGEEMKWERMQ